MNQLLQTFQDFHFLRPWWLLGLLIVVGLGVVLLQQRQRQGNWSSLIPASLLNVLIDGEQQRRRTFPLWGLLFGWCVITLGLAGPTWEKLPQPVQQSEHALVILLDLSPSMLAEDVKPSRLIRARLKLLDLLQHRQEGLTALIAYAGEAYVVTPLTDDTRTISSLLPTLSPEIMPLSGSNIEMAITSALQLFADAGVQHGDIVLVTDGIDSAAEESINQQLTSAFRLSIIGVGTSAGAPIPLSQGGFAKDNGEMILAKLDESLLQSLSQKHHGRYYSMAVNDKDIQGLGALWNQSKDATRETTREFDSWHDVGYWLAIACLPLCLLAFRRGWLLSLMPLLLIVQPHPAEAGVWQDLWKNDNQQAQQLLEQGEHQAAAEKFQDPLWQGKAHYEAGDYAAAAKDFAQQQTAEADYNRGNALAKLGKLDDAIKAYEQALASKPDLEDAAFNKDLVEKLKQQQDQQQGEDQDKNSDQNKDQNQDKDQQDQNGQEQQDNSQDASAASDPSDKSSESSADDNQQQNAQAQNQPTDDNQDSGKPDNAKPDEASSAPDTTEQTSADNNPQDPGNNNEDSENEGDEQTDEQQAGTATESENPINDEQQQALDQWLRRIPDDPAALMRRKFEYQYHQRRREYRAGTWQPPENEANKRW